MIKFKVLHKLQACICVELKFFSFKRKFLPKSIQCLRQHHKGPVKLPKKTKNVKRFKRWDSSQQWGRGESIGKGYTPHRHPTEDENYHYACD